jgi:hypothetical protein
VYIYRHTWAKGNREREITSAKFKAKKECERVPLAARKRMREDPKKARAQLCSLIHFMLIIGVSDTADSCFIFIYKYLSECVIEFEKLLGLTPAVV